MKPLAECLNLIQGKSLEEFTREHPHPVLIGLGVIAGELQRNPTKAAGTMFLSLGSVTSGNNNDPFVNQVFEITTSQRPQEEGITVGSGPENDIAIPDSSISKVHAHFFLTSDGCSIVDLGSTNGSNINGTKIEPSVPTPMRGGDILTLGRFSFTYYDPLSFAKLIAVQAMAGRSRPAPRTPGSVKATGPAVPPRPGVPPTRMPGAPQPATAPWNQPTGNVAPAGRPMTPGNVRQTGENLPPWQSGGAAQPQDWQQRAIGRGPAVPGQPGNQPGTVPVQNPAQGGAVSGGTPGGDSQLPARTEPTSWFGRLVLRLANWLRRLAGGQ